MPRHFWRGGTGLGATDGLGFIQNWLKERDEELWRLPSLPWILTLHTWPYSHGRSGGEERSSVVAGWKGNGKGISLGRTSQAEAAGTKKKKISVLTVFSRIFVSQEFINLPPMSLLACCYCLLWVLILLSFFRKEIKLNTYYMPGSLLGTTGILFHSENKPVAGV